MKMTYKGESIRYIEDRDVWSCSRMGAEKKSLKEVKAIINKVLSDDLKGKEMDVILRNYNGFEVMRVTSFTDDGQHLWVKNSEGRRSRERLDQVYECSKANLNRLGQVESLTKEIEKLREKRNVVSNKMVVIKVKESK